MVMLLVVTPFAGALVCTLLRGRATALAGRLTALATLAVTTWFVSRGGNASGLDHRLGGWGQPLGIEVHADGLSLIFLLLTSLTGAMVSLYAGSYFTARTETSSAGNHFWPLWLFLWGGLHGLYLSSDVFNLYVLLEVASLSSVALATLSRRSAALSASLRYLLAAMVGSLVFLLGVTFLYASHGVLDIRPLGEAAAPTLPVIIAFGLMLFGLLIKTALLPFHFWLPPAHGNAAAPVSAILSALVIKGAYYLVLRIWFGVFPGLVTFPAAQFLGALGALAIVWGSLQAIRQKRLKLLVAHSTVSQIGYLFLLFPLTAPSGIAGQARDWELQAWTGGICQVFAHGVAKAALFMAVGNIIYALGTDRISSLHLIAGRMPLTTFTLGLAGVSLMGLPPSGGFVAKWMTLNAILASGQWWWVPVIVAGGLLTAGYVFLILGHAFRPPGRPHDLIPVPKVMEITALLLALSGIALGFQAEELIDLLGSGPFLSSIPGGGP